MKAMTSLLCSGLFTLASLCVAAQEDPPGDEATQPEENEPEVIVDQQTGETITEPVVSWVEDPTEPMFDEEVSPVFLDEQEGPPAPRYGLQKIVIKGNRKTMRRVILRYLDLKPGEVFSVNDPRLEMARYRLLATGFFTSVNMSLKRGERRGWAVLVIRVKERNTIRIKDFMFGVSEITPYGSIGMTDNSFLGTGIQLSGSVVASKKQFGYRLALADDHFLNTDVGLHVEGLYANARDFFGHDNIQVNAAGDDINEPYAVLNYKRAGIQIGTGYTLLLDYFFWLDYHIEAISADVPTAGSHYSFGERRPIEFGHLLPGNSALSSIMFGLARDTRDHQVLPSEGSLTDFTVELSTEVIGSDYDYSKFTLAHDTYFPLGKGHSIKLGLFGGLIMGDSPFYNQFFVGDYSAFIPSRLLELNFSHLQSALLGTSVQEMRYEDMVGNLNLEYSIPFYRGAGLIYGINGFVGAGIFAIASKEDLRTDPKGYEGYKVVPMDLTFDLGVRIDTKIGVIIFSMSNLFRLIPNLGSEMAE